MTDDSSYEQNKPKQLRLQTGGGKGNGRRSTRVYAGDNNDDYDLYKRIMQAVRKFERQTGKVPTIDEIVNETGIHIGKLREILSKFLPDSTSEGSTVFFSSLKRSLGMKRLPKQTAMPSERDLDLAFHEAENSKQLVELCWGNDGQNTYLITVAPGNDPIWSLYQGEEVTENPIWRHITRDLGLIQSMIFQCVPDEIKMPRTKYDTLTAFSSDSLSMMPPESSKSSLQGRLENMQIATLVQSIQMSNMSGRLGLFDQGLTAQIYFLNGAPVHSSNCESVGDLALVEIMTWEQGEFRFYPEDNTDQRTIKRRIDGMIMEGITLLDQYKFLQKQGLTPESYLIRKEQRISPDEFKARVSQGAPLDLATQMSMYELCDGRSRFQDLLTRRPMIKVEWVPILFNLVSCGLVVICKNSPFGGKAQGLVGSELDRGMIVGVMRSLVRAETGMYTYPALQFFIDREFNKGIALGMPLSLIVFEARIVLTGAAPQPLPVQAVREINTRIETIKRSFDILAHYETFDFAILLPGATTKSARMFGHRVADLLISVPLVPGQSQRLMLAGGIASAPDDTQDLGRFLSAVREAKIKAKEARVPLIAFSEL